MSHPPSLGYMSLDTRGMMLEFLVPIRATIFTFMNDSCFCVIFNMPRTCLHSISQWSGHQLLGLVTHALNWIPLNLISCNDCGGVPSVIALRYAPLRLLPIWGFFLENLLRIKFVKSGASCLVPCFLVLTSGLTKVKVPLLLIAAVVVMSVSRWCVILLLGGGDWPIPATYILLERVIHHSPPMLSRTLEMWGSDCWRRCWLRWLGWRC